MGVTKDSEMASAVGAFTEGGTATTPPGPLTFSFTNTNGGYMVVSVGCGKRGILFGGLEVTGITYNGVALTKVVEVSTDSIHDLVGIWDLLSPAVGANNIVVTLLNNGSWVYDVNSTIIAGALTVTGHDPVTPLVASQTASFGREADGSSIALATPGNTAVGGLVVAAAAVGGAISAVSNTESWRKNVNTNSTGGNAGMQTAAGTGGVVTPSFTHGTDWGQIVLVEIKAAASLTDKGRVAIAKRGEPEPFSPSGRSFRGGFGSWGR